MEIILLLLCIGYALLLFLIKRIKFMRGKRRIITLSVVGSFFIISTFISVTVIKHSKEELITEQEEHPENIEELIDFVVEEYINNVEKFYPPLPDKYMSSITSEQGLRSSFSEEELGVTAGGIWHNGIDIACPEKTPVYAAKSGIVYDVWRSYYNGSRFNGHKVYGGLIIIYHTDNTISLYGHLSRTDVQIGEWVEQGQQIGLSGGVKGKRGSGTSTGPHLHFLGTINLVDFIEFNP